MDEQIARASIDSINQLFKAAIFASDAKRIASFYDPEAVIVSTGAPEVKGRGKIEQLASAIGEMKVTQIDYDTRTFALVGSNAIQTASYRVTTTSGAGGAARVEDGQSMVVWRRDAGGSWRIYREMQAPTSGVHIHGPQ